MKVSYSPKAWYDKIKNHAVTTEFIVLSPEEVSCYRMGKLLYSTSYKIV